jgi:hypothetical protein
LTAKNRFLTRPASSPTNPGVVMSGDTGMVRVFIGYVALVGCWGLDWKFSVNGNSLKNLHLTDIN